MSLALPRNLFVASAIAASVGCTTSRPAAEALAARQAASCGGESPPLDEVGSPRNVVRVEPLYGTVDSRPNGPESRLLGAKLHLRGAGGISAEELKHELYCHAASEVLHAKEACPYWLPDGWVDIGVASDPEGFVVTLQGKDFSEAHQILTRAEAFARK